MTVGFHPAAERELRAAASYYEQRVAGLGEDLIQEIERVCRLIEEFPDLGARIDPVHRRLSVRKFPFVVFYRTGERGIVVLAIAHESRKPGYWRTRS